MSKTGKQFNFKNEFINYDKSQASVVNDSVVIFDHNFKPIVNQKYEYINFDIQTHYEEFLELKNVALGLDSNNTASIPLKNIDELNLYKFSSKLEYNFLIKEFEENTKNLSSLSVPYFYTVVQENIEKNEYSGFEGTSYLTSSEILLTSTEQQQPYIINNVKSNLLLNNKSITLENYLKRFSPFKEQFPYYTEIRFDAHEKVEKNVSDIFNKYDVYSTIFNSLINTSEQQELYINDSESAKTYNVLSLNQEYIENLLENNSNLNVNLVFDLNSVLESKLNNIKDILTNKKSYTEVIGYHIRKYEGLSKPTENGRGTPLQQWYVPNMFSGRPEFIDTQLIYGREYTYTFNPIILTFTYDTIYAATNVANEFTYNLIPNVKIIDIDDVGASYTNRLLDSPPLEPEAEFIPFIGVPNKIQINLNTSIGRKTVTPIYFTDSEKQKIDQLILSQNSTIEENLLFYQADEPSDFFEIYRLPYKPSTYLDFANNLLTKVSSNGASGATIIDTIAQNKKYYYVIRSIDYHGNISNPTVIYEIEILNDNGLIVPYINVVDFYNPDENKIYSRNVKRFFRLAPAARHLILNEEKLNSSSVTLGNDEIAVWDQKYKIRITSKKTGKKVDLYATFKYKKKDS